MQRWMAPGGKATRQPHAHVTSKNYIIFLHLSALLLERIVEELMVSLVLQPHALKAPDPPSAAIATHPLLCFRFPRFDTHAQPAEEWSSLGAYTFALPLLEFLEQVSRGLLGQ